MILITEGERQKSRQGPRPFCFEAMWVGHERCSKIIEESWHHSGGRNVFNSLLENIQTYGELLKAWNKVDFGHVQYNLHKAQTNLRQVQESNPILHNKETNKVV